MNAVANTFARFCFLQLLGICGSVIISVIDVESIVITGPLFTATGLVVACGWIVSRDVSTLAFGLSTGVVSLSIFLLIFSLEWSPSDAQFPVPLMLLGYEVVVVPVGLLSMYRTLVASRRDKVEHRWQFSLRSLLIVTFVVGICCSATKIAFALGFAAILAAAVGWCVSTIITAGIVWRHASRHCASADVMSPKPFNTDSESTPSSR